MKKFASIALLTVASMAQVAHGNEPLPESTFDTEVVPPSSQRDTTSADHAQLAYWSLDCPDGTGPTEVGHCQPYWDFD